VKRLYAIIGLLWCFAASAAEVIPPAPKLYFNDYAGVVSSATADRLNRTLEDFEKQTSSQIWVAVYPRMESDSSIEDYTVRVKRAWKLDKRVRTTGSCSLCSFKIIKCISKWAMAWKARYRMRFANGL